MEKESNSKWSNSKILLPVGTQISFGKGAGRWWKRTYLSWGLVFLSWFFGWGLLSSSYAAVLRVQISGEPISWDPALAEDGLAMKLLPALHRPLFMIQEGGEVAMGAAHQWKWLKGGTELEVNLGTWTWNDGQPLVAQDYVRGLARVLDPAVPSKLADLFFLLRGAEAFKKGKLSSFQKVGVEALDDHRIRFRLRKRAPHFLALLALPLAYPYRGEGKTSGDYELSSRVPGQKIVLTRRSTTAGPERIEYHVISDEGAAFRLFQTGKLDLLTRVPHLEVEGLKRIGVLHSFPFFAVYYLGFRTRSGFWSQVLHRRLLAEAINFQERAEISKLIPFDGQPARGWVHPALMGKSGVAQVGSLDSPVRSGRVPGPGDRDRVLIFDGGARNQSLMEKVQSVVKRKLGWDLDLRSSDWKNHIVKLSDLDNGPIGARASSFGLFRMGWQAPFAHPLGALSVLRSGSLQNYTGWKSAAFDKVLNELESTIDPSKVTGLVAKAEELMRRDVPVIPLYHYVQNIALRPDWSGLSANGLGQIHWSRLKFSEGHIN